MGTVKISTALLMVAVMAISRLDAAEKDSTGYVELSSRTFPNDRSVADQAGGSGGSVAVQSELYWLGSEGRVQLSAVAFGRHDSADGERSHLDLRKANVGVTGNGWDVNLGVNKVFWGVTESRHLLDVLNQTDLVEDIDEEEKLGQPMINFSIDRNVGRFELYLLPLFRERTFPGVDGRLRSALPVDTGAAIFQSRDGKRHRDVSVRYGNYFGDFDIGAYVFDGTSREPRFELSSEADSLLPVYEQMRQFGVDVQLTRGAWLWKLEAISRDAASDSFTASVSGFEYTFFGARRSATDVGVLFEYLHDGRNRDAPPTLFDNDVFLGARLAFNDVSDTSVLAGAIVDIDTQETFVSVEASRRFGGSLTLDARLRLFGNAGPQDESYWIENDDYLEIALSWYY